MTFQSLLPRNASPLSMAIEEATYRTYSIDFAIEALDNPERAPADFLPFMGWGLSTDLWDRGWPIEKKRAVVKAWYNLHRKKGTLTGIKEAVRFFGGEIVGVRRPPGATYPDPAMTRDEREAYLSRFQQIRIYDFRGRGLCGFGAYLSSGYRLPRLFAGGKAFPFVSDAVVRVGKRAFLFDPRTGIEAPVRSVSRTITSAAARAVEFEEVYLPANAGFACFIGEPPRARMFAVDTGPTSRRYTLAVDATYVETSSSLHLSAIQPSETPIDVRPRKQKVVGGRGIGSLFPSLGGVATEFVNRSDDGNARTFLPRSSSVLRIYDQVFLFDPARLADRRGARTFLGHTRLGMPAYHAEMQIKTRAVISRFAVQRYVNGFVVATDKSRLAKAIEAVRVSKSLRDKITVTAKTMRPVAAGDGVKIGTTKLGAWVRHM